MAILRYGPWADIIPHLTQGLYQNYDAPTHLPSATSPTGLPVNCAKTDWASGAAWSSLATTSYFDPVYFFEAPYYEEKPINTQISDTAYMTTSLCRFSFHYQATSDFTMSMEWTCNPQLFYGSWYYEIISLDSNGDKVTDQQFTTFGDGVSTSYSGTETLNIPASTIGTVTCYVDNFGSDFTGDTCTLKIY
jgi:hypothetical protein